MVRLAPPPTRPPRVDEQAGEQPVLWIHPSRGLRLVDFGSLWAYRELLLYFGWRDIKVRYKQTLLGAAWILILPITQMLIFATIFGRIVGLPSEGVPYAVFAFSGLAAWTYFASTVSKMSTSLDGNMHLITKVYFPRIVLPISVMLGTLVDFSIMVPIVLVMAVFTRGTVLASWAALPAAVALLLAVTLGVGIWLAALNARFRDVILALPIVLQVGFYLTPVVYSASIVERIVGEPWLPVLALLNPMLGVVELFRWSALGTSPPQLVVVALSALAALVLLVSGSVYFAHTERTVVDRI
ncbi:MAG: ABC transporter permease [Chloroflexota bacterium]|nr:ABC transporter permease [Chloroflexota bacterium]